MAAEEGMADAARNWLDNLYFRGVQAARGKPANLVAQESGPDAPPVKVRSALNTTWIQTRPPSDTDPGAVELGFYDVEGGVLTLRSKSTNDAYHYREPDSDWVV